MSAISWMAEEKVVDSVKLEPVLVLLSLAVITWFAYKLLLRKTSYERHRIFRAHFQNLVGHIAIGMSLYGLYELISWVGHGAPWSQRTLPYIGFLAVFWGCIVFIKTLRIIAYEYLFLVSRGVGVPLLLVNIFTLVVSLVVGGWVLTRFFQVNLTPLLATSAILSIVLGLALQDTLGNLFAAIALQIDKPFELGDWIEVKSGSEKVAGQVQEISWRATVLLAITDELITIPNRNMAQWQISNFSGRYRPFIRSHVFRIPHDSNIEMAKDVLLKAADSIPGILKDPAPIVIATETTESWITLKAIYFISDYGTQFGIADRFLTKALDGLAQAGVRMATSRLTIHQSRETG